jgi:hypothetical protein
VVVGRCEVVGVEAVAVGMVSLDGVAELATCRTRRVSKMNMQTSGYIRVRLVKDCARLTSLDTVTLALLQYAIVF